MSLLISKIPRTKFDDLLHEHGLQGSSITFNLPLDGAMDIPAFRWGRGSEASQADRCIKWFQTHIPRPDGVKYYSTSGESDLLTTSLASSRYERTRVGVGRTGRTRKWRKIEVAVPASLFLLPIGPLIQSPGEHHL